MANADTAGARRAGVAFRHRGSKQEILYRRIGANEISTIQICQALVAAEKEYYAMQHNRYAGQFYSDAGQENGLYWPAIDGQPKSPIGPLVASAEAAGYRRNASGAPSAYHGYLHRILTEQGKHAPGGAKSYVQDGRMTGGFAFLAYPAEYRSSGVMTFVVGEDGVVHEKDLGHNTEALGRAMKAYDPDSSWRHSEDEQEKAAAQQDR